MKSIWEIELETRNKAKPKIDSKSDWTKAHDTYIFRRESLINYWDSHVPGSNAPDNFFQGAVLAWYNQGYDVSKAEALLESAKPYIKDKNWGELEKITALICYELNNAKINPEHIYHKYITPTKFDDIVSSKLKNNNYKIPENYKERIDNGLLCQIAGGAYGTALEGYTGQTLRETFGEKLKFYVSDIDTFNDDITFEIAFLEALDERNDKTKSITSFDIAKKWLELIPYAWSAEHYALENLRRGIFPPESATTNNYFSEWIGAQMRTMIAGLVAPANPYLASKLAYEDSIISHTKNGVYAGIHSAVLVSLSFVIDDTRELLKASREYIPNNTMFAHFFDITLKACENSENHIEAFEKVFEEAKIFHWIHAIPNMMAVVISLYFGGRELTKCFNILGELGLDVDCNAGEVGTILGVMTNSSFEKWTMPLSDTLDTYLPKFSKISITSLSEKIVKNTFI